MENIKAQIDNDFYKALKAQDVSLNVIRMLKSAIKNAEIEKKNELNNLEIMRILQKERKQRLESIEEFTKGKRNDLVEKEQYEFDIIDKYLPKPLSDQEITTMVRNTIAILSAKGPQDMGKVMTKLMSDVLGRADGEKVSQIVKKELSKLNG